jgi:hypothetical protein
MGGIGGAIPSDAQSKTSDMCDGFRGILKKFFPCP